MSYTWGFVNAQSGTRYAFVNLDYILNNIPDYIRARQELDNYSLALQEKIDAIYQEIATLQGKYNAEKIFLTAAMKEQREKAIAEKENQARLLQEQYFGAKGELLIKRNELIKPIQAEVLEAIKEIAKENSYGMIIDVSADNSVVYYDPKLDKSDMVLRKLGYRIKQEK